jgi:signal transduction histidine kinase
MPYSKTSRAVVVTNNPVDAELAIQLLGESDIHATICENIGALYELLPQEIGCIILAGESLAKSEIPLLREMIESQPAWSDMPLIFVAADSAELNAMVEREFPNSGNLTLLEQPLNQATLVSAVRVGLRARARQLEVLNLLTQRDEALRLRDEFLAMLAHELRNPLAPMRNAVFLQQKLSIDDPTFVKTRDIFDRQVTHLSRMVDDLLDVARLERGKLQLQRERIDLNTMVTATVDTCLPAIQSREHRVKINLAREPLFIDADPVRIEQLLTNLITNAAKFTPDPGEITLETRQDGNSATVSVRDTGIGLSPQMVHTVFLPFMQDDRTLARSHGGLGIGLTISRRLAELHDGSLQASSRGLNKGSVFTARFPLASRTPMLKSDSPRPVLFPPDRRRILIVEDNADIRDSLRMVLEIWGHEVTSADSGQQGLDLIRRIHPDVALIDIGLPGMSGYEVAQTIRTAASPLSSQIKLVAITGYGQPDDRERTRKAGFDMHLLKPIDPQVLQKILANE